MRAPLAAAVLACVPLAGCGGGSAQPATTTAATPTAPGDAQIAIDEPSDGQALRGRAAPGGGLVLRARVRGRARPGARVVLSASCRPRPCTAAATAGRGGRWSARVQLRTPRAGRFVTIDAGAQRQVVAAGSAVVTVELVSAERTREAIRTDARRAGRKQVPRARRAAPVQQALPHEVLVIGDSLAVGMADALRAALPGWSVSVDAQTSRSLQAGMQILGARPRVPAILAFSLFTNDDPRSAPALEAAVRATAARPGACAVWATIAAPPVRGVGYGRANQLLRGLAADPQRALRLQIVDWSAEVASLPSLLAGDGVHATPDGYGARAQSYAAAIRSCAGG